MSLEQFARVCFPHACRLPFSPLHRYLFDRRAAKTSLPLEARTGVIDVVLAPRGAAKSTLVSCIFPLHALLHGGEHYIVLISATLRQAQRRIAAMRAALRPGGSLANRFARADDGEPLVRHATTTAIEVREARIEVFGAGAEMRGISHGPWRPTWIILDDVERGDRTLVARHRDAMADWFHEVVENLGDRYTNIDLIGTLLHPDALPARLAERPDVVARTFRSIISEATDQTLWDRWRALFHDLSDADRLANARAFFEANREAMLAGAQVLWPEKEDYYALQVMRETRGRAAFDKEKQTAPLLADRGIFVVGDLRWFAIEGDLVLRREAGDVCPAPVPLARLRRFAFLDPSMGHAGGDFAAIATVGLDPEGYLYVLDVWMARVAPSAQGSRQTPFSGC